MYKFHKFLKNTTISKNGNWALSSGLIIPIANYKQTKQAENELNCNKKK